jgi:tmRNA-binding protein
MVVLGVERIYKFVPGKELYLREMKLNSREVEMTFQWKDERIRSLPLDKEDLRAIRLQMAGLF